VEEEHHDVDRPRRVGCNPLGCLHCNHPAEEAILSADNVDWIEQTARALAALDPEIGEEGYDVLPETRRKDLPPNWCKSYWRSLSKQAHDGLANPFTRAAELQRTFDLRWDADMRAIKRWQAANPGNDLVWPDRADLVVWLLERDAERAAKLKEELQRYATGDNRTEYGRGWNCAMEEAESIVERILSCEKVV
jgi:hypothetical protein